VTSLDGILALAAHLTLLPRLWARPPSVFKGLRSGVLHVVPRRWRNVGEHPFRERHVGMLLDIGNAAPMQDHQRLLSSFHGLSFMSR
jgi:hypothetical protein